MTSYGVEEIDKYVYLHEKFDFFQVLQVLFGNPPN